MFRSSAAGAAVAAAALLLGATPALGDDGAAGAEHRPAASLTMTMTAGILASAAESSGQVLLECGPDGGTHPDPEGACDSLRAVNGEFDELPPIPGMMCIDVYDPVSVTVEGYWAQHSPEHPGLIGQPRDVDFQEGYSNRCQAAVQSDGVFDFNGYYI